MSRKKAIVTGGSRGIGHGIALHLAQKGYDLAVSYYSCAEEAAALAGQVQQDYGAQCHCFEAHLEVPGEAGVFFEKAVAALGGLDLLVNNAGMTKFENILDMRDATIDKLVNLDFITYMVLMRCAANHMVDHGVRGSIVNITSTRAERAYPGDALYGGLKAGLNRAIQSAALDLAPYGVRVNNVAPGATRIRSRQQLQQQSVLPVDFWDRMGERIPLGRSGEPEDIAKAVAFLASEDAAYITGVTLRVDGGLILPGMPEIWSDDNASGGWGVVKKRERTDEHV